MAGGRHPMKAKYSVGFKSNGKITALHLDLGINAGISPDLSPVLPFAIIGALKKYNWGSLEFDTKICKTNVSSKSAMRAPGDVQGSFIAEAIMEHVASALSVDTNTVRRKNLHDFESLVLFYGESAGEASTYSLVSMFDKLALSPDYQLRAATIEQFNRSNRWKKRGISCVPITYEVGLRPTPGKVSIMNDGSIVVEVGGIEIGQGLWTKVKQMTAFGLGQLCRDGGECLLDKRLGNHVPHSTSETSCAAVGQSCAALVERLKPIKERLEAAKGNTLEWGDLIAQASMVNVNLSAHAYWTPDATFTSYLNYGAAISEVEVDVLTGATTILRSDLVYDCGQSLNPAVDLGQIEGSFVQGVGFFTNEEYTTNSDGLVIHDGTWTYEIPSGHHPKAVQRRDVQQRSLSEARPVFKRGGRATAGSCMLGALRHVRRGEVPGERVRCRPNHSQSIGPEGMHQAAPGALHANARDNAITLPSSSSSCVLGRTSVYVGNLVILTGF
ncbi:unnamed protein product [Miscanthus lutarioriparius]|uniref:Aldehyde oxidase/xanthine dehydrogenase second molybdopterin binding domain-containing protein n=1 Tax=Miscanthus lutarioriparius TaxID=422564 RepID=A0A811MJ20_9POAL|nr:unnamed protein product [Miscanthus lutarioriparius]